FFERTWTAPPAPPSAPPPPPAPACQVPNHQDEINQPFFITVSIDIDTRLEDFMKPVVGGLPLITQSFNLFAGSTEKETFGLDAKTFSEMLSPDGFRKLNNNLLYGSKITITEAEQFSDGTRTEDISTFYLYRFIDATDDNHTDSTIDFEDTLADGQGRVTRVKDISVLAEPSSIPNITISDGMEAYSAVHCGNTVQLFFNPTKADKNQTGRLAVRSPEGIEADPSRINLLGNGRGQTIIAINKTGLIATLNQLVMNPSP